MTPHGEVLYKNCVYLSAGFHSSTYSVLTPRGEVLYKNCVYLPVGFHSSTYDVLYDSTWRGSI